MADRWRKWPETYPLPFNPSDWSNLSSEQHVEVLAQLLAGPPLTPSKVQILGQTYDLARSRNCEIRFRYYNCTNLTQLISISYSDVFNFIKPLFFDRWIRLGLKARWQPAIGPALEFVTEQGRMKYVRPIYRYEFLFNVLCRHLNITQYTNLITALLLLLLQRSI